MSRANLTIVQTYYHQQEGMEPVSIDCRTTRPLHTGEQSYVRHTKVGNKWVQLETGWMNECSLLVIRNNEGKFVDKVPTDAQRLEMESRVVEIAFANGGERTAEALVPCLEVLPKESHQLHPVTLKNIFLRCRDQSEAKVSIILIPK